MTAYYACRSCPATKEIRAIHPGHPYPQAVPCGWRGCRDQAVFVPEVEGGDGDLG